MQDLNTSPNIECELDNKYDILESYNYIFDKNYIDTNELCIKKLILDKLDINNNSKVLILGTNLKYLVSYFTLERSCYCIGLEMNNNNLNDDSNDDLYSFNSNFDKLSLESNYYSRFDYVISNNCLINLEDKDKFIITANRYLNTNGTLYLVEHCSGIRCDLNDEYLEYNKENNYDIYNIYSYAGILDKYKFTNVKIKDIVPHMMSKINNELNMLEENHIYFSARFKNYNNIYNLWKKKQHWYSERCLSWGVLSANKL